MRSLPRVIQVDTHTHTTMSGHAWSTLDENCRAAAEMGLAGICLTDHGPAMDRGMPWFGPCSFPRLPHSLHGVVVVPGVEFNILDRTGRLDIDRDEALRHVRFGVASMHDVTMPRTTRVDHTDAYIAALANPAVHMLGHPGYSYFDHDPEPIVREAKRLDKLIEINNASFSSRQGSRDNCMAFARLCKAHDVRVCVSSDAHVHTAVGRVDEALAMLDEAGFPDELILNLDANAFFAHVSGSDARSAIFSLADHATI